MIGYQLKSLSLEILETIWETMVGWRSVFNHFFLDSKIFFKKSLNINYSNNYMYLKVSLALSNSTSDRWSRVDCNKQLISCTCESCSFMKLTCCWIMLICYCSRVANSNMCHFKWKKILCIWVIKWLNSNFISINSKKFTWNEKKQ